MLAMSSKVAVIGIAARVLGEDVEEVMLRCSWYEPEQQSMQSIVYLGGGSFT